MKSSTNYKTISATGLVYTGATLLHGLTITGGSANSTVELRDWTDSTGGAIIVKLESLANISESISFDRPISVKTGIYATLSGTGATATIICDGDFTTTSTTTSTSTSTSTS